MCGVSGVSGASGAPAMAGGAPAKMTDAPPPKVAGDGGPGKDAKGGGSEGAVAGANALGGGDTGLKAALEGVVAAVKALSDVIAKMGTSGGGGHGGCGGGGEPEQIGNKPGQGVLGVTGTAAAADQFVGTLAATATAQAEDSNFEQRVLELINVERSKNGLGPVAYNSTLDNAAEKHASHMAIVGRMAHDGIGDGTPGERIRGEGWNRSWGENVATGQTSPEQVVREWMNSPDHRRNILDPGFRQMGIGLVTGSNGRTFWAQELGA